MKTADEEPMPGPLKAILWMLMTYDKITLMVKLGNRMKLLLLGLYIIIYKTIQYIIRYSKTDTICITIRIVILNLSIKHINIYNLILWYVI